VCIGNVGEGKAQTVVSNWLHKRQKNQGVGPTQNRNVPGQEKRTEYGVREKRKYTNSARGSSNSRRERDRKGDKRSERSNQQRRGAACRTEDRQVESSGLDYQNR